MIGPLEVNNGQKLPFKRHGKKGKLEIIMISSKYSIGYQLLLLLHSDVLRLFPTCSRTVWLIWSEMKDLVSITMFIQIFKICFQQKKACGILL